MESSDAHPANDPGVRPKMTSQKIEEIRLRIENLVRVNLETGIDDELSIITDDGVIYFKCHNGIIKIDDMKFKIDVIYVKE